MQTKLVKITELKPAGYNPRKITDWELRKLMRSLETFGFVEPVVVNKDMTIIGGHQRVKAAEHLGIEEIPCIFVDLPKGKEKALNLALNRISGEFDEEKLAELLSALTDEEAMLSGFDQDEINGYLQKQVEAEERKNALLTEKFLIPPFSVLDTRQGYWQDRKRLWLDVGLKSELGRKDDLTFQGGIGKDMGYYQKKKDVEQKLGHEITKEEFEEKYFEKTERNDGTSVFDPVLCELIYRWYSAPDAKVLDPFAGGSVRGIVAAKLGRDYTGVDLRAEQVEANREQAGELVLDMEKMPRWEAADSRTIDKVAPGQYDLVFSCPPYADLEVYSDKKEDLSNMDYPEFVKIYREIIAKSVAMLKENRFACFVVGDVRAPDGSYRNFIGDTIKAFEDAGAKLYNEAILVNVAGSLPIRAGRQFEAGRKLGKMHQNVLVFWKGDTEEVLQEVGSYFTNERKLAEAHEKVLIFIKGDAGKATKDAGTVVVDDDAFIQGVGETTA